MIDGVCEKFHIGTALIAGMWSSIPRQLAASPMMLGMALTNPAAIFAE
jgi:hypothetical protein